MLVCLCTVARAELRVYPSEVVVGADYPARLVVIESLADQVSWDRTRDASLRVQIPAELPLAWTSDGTLIVRQEESSSAAIDGRITVGFHDQVCEVPVRIAATKSSSPIYAREITALLGKSGCNLGTCHGNLHGKGGFRLSLRGDDPAMDYSTIVRGDAARRIDLLQPEESLLIRKPLGTVAHQGGVRFSVDSTETKILERWIREGCQWNANTGAPVPASNETPRPDETLHRLTVSPSTALLAKGCREQQLVVTAHFADGTTRDVTRWSRFEASEVTGVAISRDGLVQAEKPIDVAISVSYLSGRTAARVTFLAHESKEWHAPNRSGWIDDRVHDQLARLQIEPTPTANEGVFLRRASLVTIGRLPTAEEARAYFADQSADKKERLVERLLQDRGYAYLWALRWSDLLRNEQKVMSPEGAEGWHNWMVQQISMDRPINEFVAEMLTTTGSTYENPPASFHRTHRDPETAAESIGQVFLGVRLQCARCHNHPFDVWRQDDYYGLAAYFTTLQRKQIDNQPKDKFDKHIISGDEVVSLSDKAAEIWHPGRAENVSPKPLDAPFRTSKLSAPTSQESKDSESQPGEIQPTDTQANPSPLQPLAMWLTQNNRMFARNMANRVWYHMMGRGIVDPPDDFRDSNPPSNPALLEALTDELIRNGYSVRQLTRQILLSETFARSSAHEPDSTDPLSGVAMFAGYPLHRMSAEVLYDALSDVTGVEEDSERKDDRSESKAQRAARAIARADVPTRSGFLTTFGKPGRLLVCECERSSDTSLGQSLMLVNGVETREKLASKENRLTRLLETKVELPQLIDELYLTALTRFPTPAEREAMVDYFDESVDRRLALEDMLWALVNSKEFSLIQ